MADDEEHHPLKPLTLLSPNNTLIAWERIQLPSFPTTQFPQPLLLSPDPNTTLVKKQSTPLPPVHNLVFPPTNHEGLNINLNRQFNDSEKICDEKVNVKVKDELTVKPVGKMVGPGEVKWWFLRFKLPKVVRGGFDIRFFGSVVVMLLFYLRFRRCWKRRLRRETVDELLGVIKEKDERIHCLLYQIARMNELLLATRHGVPMISKAASS